MVLLPEFENATARRLRQSKPTVFTSNAADAYAEVAGKCKCIMDTLIIVYYVQTEQQGWSKAAAAADHVD